MKLKLALIVLLLMSSCCFATGWHDYRLDIGDGYIIFRANALDVGLSKRGGSIIVSPTDYDGVGPIVSYANKEKFVFTRNIGTKDRHLVAGDPFQDLDHTNEFYFIVSKEDDEVIGPLSETDFVNHPNVLSVNAIDWHVPKNPNFWTPLGGNLLFCFSSALISISVISGIVLILIIRKKRKRQLEKN